jgi:SAM-dependent methyltransferase
MDYSKIADLYDSYVQVDFDVPFFLEYARQAENVLELMSGTGRLSIPLAQAGVNLTCVDSSPEMLTHLRQKAYQQGLSFNVVQADVTELDLGQTFDLILLPFGSFSEITEPEAQRKALATIRRHLGPGGKFICTLGNPPARLQIVGQGLKLRGKIEEPDRIILLWSQEDYDPDSQLVSGMQFVEVYDAAGVMVEKRFVEINFYLHQIPDLETLLASSSFRIVKRFGDYQQAPFDPEKSPYAIWELEGA